MELVLVVFCIGLFILGVHEEVSQKGNKKVKEKEQEPVSECNKYEEGTGLRFIAIDEDDSIADFRMGEEEEIERVDYLQDGLYGKVEGENLFSFGCRRRLPEITIEEEPKEERIIETFLDGCPPLIARHFFGRDYTASFAI